MAASGLALSKLTTSERAIFASGESVLGLKETAIGSFLLFYLTAVCGLSGTLAGLALFLSLMVDAVSDPLIGYLSDNSRSRYGRRHPFMLLSAVPHFIAFGLLFSASAIENQWLLFVYTFLTLTSLRIAHSFFTLPYAALYAEMSRDYRERSTLAAYRSFSYFCGNIIAVLLGFSVFMAGDDGLLKREGYAAFGWTCAALALGAAVFCTLGTYRLRHRMHQTVVVERSNLRHFLREVHDVVRSRSFLILFFTILAFWVSQGAHFSLSLHAYKYFWELPSEVLQFVPISLSVGLATGIAVAMLVLRWFEKAPVCNAALAVFCFLQFTPATLRLLGLLPETGPFVYSVLNTSAFLTGWSMSCVVIAFGAMLADSADEHELLFGSRREALYFSGLTFSVKAAIGLGAFIGGVMLDVVGFPSNIASLGADFTPAPKVVRGLGLISGPGCAAISIFAVFILARYRITASEHAAIMSELDRRKRGAQPDPARGQT